ncbi:efflux RND transporter periplasmic adaptor subunit [Heminiphilus faecis]|uniref:Efflux RND transporter periplasmic adaptor subunit n=1 Tax=Heminiphilus faecis TaxID=2601703 RepID=A0ABV4CUQ7_9BACT|nr:efflux RND transporter periplasmic adaptor subunit [Heminiphilus faecis]
MNCNRYAAALLGLALMAAVPFHSCKGDGADKAIVAEVDERPNVEIRKVHRQSVDQLMSYTATVEAFKTNNITTSTPNRIKSILVDVGYKVAKGQKLVVLDDVNIDQLKVRLDNTEREYNRALELFNIGGGTKQAVDQMKTELDAARRQYDNMVENTILLSPINGVVTARNYDPGDMTGQQPILTIEQLRPVKVLINVSENEFTKVSKGMKVDVYLDVYGDEKFVGEVDLIYPVIDPATRTFTVEVVIANADERVRPGMFARVVMNFGTEERVVVPDRAIVKQTGSGEKFVYIYKDGKVDFSRVEIGQRLGDAYELLSGVENGDEVVISGQSRLADGIEVNVIKK